MTCIVGLVDNKEIWIGSDSAGTAGPDQDIYKTTKAFKRGPFIIGGSGSYRGIQLMQYTVPLDKLLPLDNYLKNPDVSIESYAHCFAELIRETFRDNGLAEIESNVEGTDTQILFGFRGRLFTLQYDFAVLESSNDYYSIGSGSVYAHGSLYESRDKPPLERVLSALRCAEYYCTGVKGPFKVLHLITDSNYEEFVFEQ